MGKRRAEATQTEMLQGTLDMLILQTLALGAAHGHTIAHVIERRSEDVLLVEHGSLYPALQRLLKAGFVTAEWDISSTNRRIRVYRLTGRGAKNLEEKVSSFERMIDGITRVLAPGEL